MWQSGLDFEGYEKILNCRNSRVRCRITRRYPGRRGRKTKVGGSRRANRRLGASPASAARLGGPNTGAVWCPRLARGSAADNANIELPRLSRPLRRAGKKARAITGDRKSVV